MKDELTKLHNVKMSGKSCVANETGRDFSVLDRGAGSGNWPAKTQISFLPKLAVWLEADYLHF